MHGLSGLYLLCVYLSEDVNVIESQNVQKLSYKFYNML